jgi:hypothetical protein
MTYLKISIFISQKGHFNICWHKGQFHQSAAHISKSVADIHQSAINVLQDLF